MAKYQYLSAEGSPGSPGLQRIGSSK